LLGVFHTTDGGEQWTQAAKLKPMEAFPGAHLQGQLRFLDELNGWLIADTGSLSLPLVYATHDGGKSWKGVSLPSPPLGANESAIISEPPHFFTSDAGLLVVQTMPICQAGTCPSPQAAPKSYLYRTNDGGDQWSGPSALPTIGSFGFNSVFFLDATHYWMVSDSTVASSVDGGQHWSIHPNVVPADLFVSQPQFVSVSEGWVIATSPKQLGVPKMALYRTTDGGAHWQAVPTPAPDLVR
jgi:photosystem II stability/assembly factor-like uncharacterized protein